MSSTFEYSAFRDPSTQIRLLDLHPVTQDVVLSASLRTYDMDALPKYEAISYTWGNAHPVHAIDVNRRSLWIRSNCYYALLQLRLRKEHRLLWIDSICINQGDVTEKSHQVQGIAQVFRQADRVLASLGPDTADSEQLVASACSLFSACERVMSHAAAKRKVEYEPVRLDGTYLPRAVQDTAYTWVKDLGDSELSATFRAFVHLSTRPYWRRLWVLPELKVASSVILHYGRKILSLESLELLRDVFQDLRNDKDFQYRAATHNFRAVESLGVNCLPFARIMCLARSRTTDQDQMPIHGAFIGFGQLQCSDVRDRVYALLPVYRWPNELPRLIVDYKKTSLELAHEVIMCCRSFRHITGLLKALQIERKDLKETNLHIRFVQPCTTDSKYQQKNVQHNACSCDRQGQVNTFPLRYLCSSIVTSVGETRVRNFKASHEMLLGSGLAIDGDGEPTDGPYLARVAINERGIRLEGLVALVPSSTMPGDVIVGDSLPGYRNRFHGLVVRERCTAVYEIIGTAYSPPNYLRQSRHIHGPWTAHGPPSLSTLETPSIVVHLSARDALLLGLQMIEAEGQALTLTAQRQSLDIPTSKPDFTSYAIRRGSDVNATNLPCGTCGRWSVAITETLK